MVTVKRFTYDDKDLMHLSNDIRRVVFIEEQHVTPEIEYEHEEEGHYYLLFIDDMPVATARWRVTTKGIKLERFAMLRDFRNKGLGSILLEEVLKDVIPMDREIYLHSQVAAVNYYARAGFRESGDRFMEADIEHVLMKYQK
jgi:predicted GNAT family N-acyltransferase